MMIVEFDKGNFWVCKIHIPAKNIHSIGGSSWKINAFFISLFDLLANWRLYTDRFNYWGLEYGKPPLYIYLCRFFSSLQGACLWIEQSIVFRIKFGKRY